MSSRRGRHPSVEAAGGCGVGVYPVVWTSNDHRRGVGVGGSKAS